MHIPKDFNDLNRLKEAGFEGFKTKASLFQDSSPIPNLPGVYLVLRLHEKKPIFLEIGTGGYFKGKDPNVCVAELELNWVKDAKVVYIGKATNLRIRLGQYLSFGQGKNVGHTGGRYIWQLKDSIDLVVCWKSTPDEDPEDVECDLIEAFKFRHSKRRPFANLKDGRTRGISAGKFQDNRR
jgi:hypothetical protein